MLASDVQGQLPAAPYTRLHITPFDESLFHVVVPSAVRPHARNLSYHTLQAFPDKPYGFVELPTDDAERLKKKLNSAVLRGHKLRIEVARTPAETTATAAHKDNSAPAPARGLRKRKREQGVIPGTEINGRKIKRGWTTSEAEMIQKKRDRSGKAKGDKKDKKDQNEVSTGTKKPKKSEVKKSKYTDEPECLFKTRLPSKAEPTIATEVQQEDEETTATPKKKKRRIERDTVIHEFERSNKFPSFLKVNSSTNSAAETLTFEDGKGWMDKDGNVLESSKSTRPPTAGIVSVKPKRAKKEKPTVNAPPQEPSDSSSSDDSSVEDKITQAASKGQGAHKIKEVDDTSSSEEESSEDDKSDSEEDEEVVSPAETKSNQDTPKITEQTAPKEDSTRPRSAGSVNNLTIKIPPATPVPVKVHPLEALYKKPQDGVSTPNKQESKGFSFFDNNDDDDDIEEEGTAATQTLQVPMTPFTERDFEFRTARSAAPTPDTAHPTRSFAPWSTQETVSEEDQDEEEEMFKGGANREADATEEDQALLDADGVHPSRAAAGNGHAPITDFQKHFWENRGDLNRKWRRRRKTAAKEKRYRDNRARADRAI